MTEHDVPPLSALTPKAIPVEPLAEFQDLLDALDRDPDELIAVCRLEPDRRDGKPQMVSRLMPVERAATYAAHYAAGDVWYSTQPLHARLKIPKWPGAEVRGRGGVKDVVGLRELAIDCDIKSRGFADEAAVMAYIGEVSAMLGQPPVALVMTGHGLQPHWAVEREEGVTDWPDETDPAHGRAVALLARFGRFCGHVADKSGSHVDSIFELARVLRVPGVHNCKREPWVPTTLRLVGGGPLSCAEISERLTEWGFPELEEDSRSASFGQRRSEPAEWGYAPVGCRYAEGMVLGWTRDAPDARHPWLLGQATRLACAHRFGCLTEQNYGVAVEALTLSFRAMLATGAPRDEQPYEIGAALDWGVAAAARKTDAEVARELGDHEHEEPSVPPSASLPPLPADGSPVAPVFTEEPTPLTWMMTKKQLDAFATCGLGGCPVEETLPVIVRSLCYLHDGDGERVFAVWSDILDKSRTDDGAPLTGLNFRRYWDPALAEYKQAKAANGGTPPGSSEPGERRVRITLASDIEPEIVQWAWHDGQGRIPAGSLSLAAGREGCGKSSWAIWLCARVTTGTLPGVFYGTPRMVLYAAVEDSWRFTIVPRLMAAGADLGLVGRLDVVTTESESGMTLSLPVDGLALRVAIKESDAVLVVLDPLLSMIDVKIDSHKNREVREALDPLAADAERTGAVVVGIAHFNKSSGNDAASLITGSGAFKDVPRSVFGFAHDKDGNVFEQVKNSLGRSDLPSLAYEITARCVPVRDKSTEVGLFAFTGESERTVRDVLDDSRGGDDDREERSDAEGWLTGYLTDAGGEASRADIVKAGKAEGFNESALKRACRKTKVTRERGGYQGGSVWRLTPFSPFSSLSGETGLNELNGLDEPNEQMGENSPTGAEPAEPPSSTAPFSSSSSFSPSRPVSPESELNGLNGRGKLVENSPTSPTGAEPAEPQSSVGGQAQADQETRQQRRDRLARERWDRDAVRRTKMIARAEREEAKAKKHELNRTDGPAS